MYSELYLTYSNLSQKQINEEFVNSCQYGCFDHIRYLLTSKDLPYQAEIDYEDNKGLVLASFYGQTDIVKYLISSPELSKNADIHARRDFVFKILCNSQNYGELKFLIKELNIEKTEYIKEYLIEHPEVNSIFLARELATEIPNTPKKQKNIKI